MDEFKDHIKNRLSLFSEFITRLAKPWNNTQNMSDRNDTSKNNQMESMVYDDTAEFKNSDIIQMPPHERQNSDKSLKGSLSDLFKNNGTEENNRLPNSQMRNSLFSPSFSIMADFENIFQQMEESLRIFESSINDPDKFFEEFSENFPENFKKLDEDDEDLRYFRIFGKDSKKSSDIFQDGGTNMYEDSVPSLNSSNYRNLMLKKTPKDSSSMVVPNNFSLFGILDSLFTQSNNGSGAVRSEVSFNSVKIKETPEGREIITIKTNKNGEIEETREFTPRKGSPTSPIPDKPNRDLDDHEQIFFRPRL